MPQIEVSFDVDANGILNVTAKDKTSGKTQSIRIEASGGLSDADVEKMKQDADKYAEQDKAARELIEVKNLADQMIYSAEKALLDHKDAIPEDTAKGVQEHVAKLREVKEKGTKEEIQSATQNLSAEMQKIGQYMSHAGGQDTGDSGQQEQSGGENVTDIEAEDSEQGTEDRGQ
jgi:molecular chaperone DnaK